MSGCPFHNTPALRAELPQPLPPRIARLPVDERGYPVPFFVQWLDGKPDFRIIDSRRMKACKVGGLCWVCGQGLDDTFAFTIGPMCAINRTTQEPPSHLECAEYSVKACPFLTRPHMKRREDEFTEQFEDNVPGMGLKRNPGVTCIWVTNHYEDFSDGKGGVLIHIGPAHSVSWWREGRTATRDEIMESIGSGIGFLRTACDDEAPENRADAHAELTRWTEIALKLLPA